MSLDRTSILAGTVKELCTLIEAMKPYLDPNSPLLGAAEKSLSEAKQLIKDK